jgi:deoxyribodipyrimidine photolyase-related protein
MAKTLRLILGDQLNNRHPWYKTTDDNVLYLLMEMRQETDYVEHHIQKVLAFFMAMRAFAKELSDNGHKVLYLQLDHKDNKHSLEANLLWCIEKYHITQFEYQLPDEYRLDVELKAICQKLKLPTSAVDTYHFLTSRSDIETFFRGKKTYLMESFYRYMRKKHQLLMNGDEPEGGQWNYDADNRKKLPNGIKVPIAPTFTPPSTELIQMVHNSGVKTIGRLPESAFYHPTTRAEALQLLRHFCEACLPLFGTYEDAMRTDGPFLFHSRLSFAMNVKLLHPLEVVNEAIEHYYNRPKEISLSQIEGFVRQIIGWREYMRGVYWAQMPAYEKLNFFEHNALLPGWFWTGNTKMNCLHHCINQSLDYAYAHHIQRLMITGNFCLLLGVHPDAVDAWYMGIYSDAIQWVEITNTRGMSQYADGGIVATKPYVASANYINSMSNYCDHCYYDKKDRIGPKACPFNALYWEFYLRHSDKLAKNPRIGMAYRQIDKMNGDTKAEILKKAHWIRENIEAL